MSPPDTEGPRTTAVITGASSGIGRATAERLGALGWRLVLAARDAQALEHTARAIDPERHGRTLTLPTDVADHDACARLIDASVEHFGRIDALVNNAGYAPLEPLGQTSIATCERSFRVNALAPAAAILRAWPHFARQRSGCVVNISTIGTIDPFPGFFAYASAKAAVNTMARSIANEGSAIGVRAFAIAPGAVETPMLRALFPPADLPPEACLDPADVAALIADCITGRRDDDNGRTLTIVREDGRVRVRVVRS